MPKKTKTKKAVKKKAQAKKRKKKVKATLTMERVLTESSDAAHEFYNQPKQIWQYFRGWQGSAIIVRGIVLNGQRQDSNKGL